MKTVTVARLLSVVLLPASDCTSYDYLSKLSIYCFADSGMFTISGITPATLRSSCLQNSLVLFHSYLSTELYTNLSHFE